MPGRNNISTFNFKAFLDPFRHFDLTILYEMRQTVIRILLIMSLQRKGKSSPNIYFLRNYFSSFKQTKLSQSNISSALVR